MRANELADIKQRFFEYPGEVSQAAEYLLTESKRGRDAYFAAHLFREPGNRRAANAVATVRALWLDEDEGSFPETGPEPTAVVASSARRRHLYWRLSRPVAVEWAVVMNRRISAWAGGDSGKAGLASVLRAPGTANYKRSPKVDPVTMEIYEAGSWDPEVMDQAIPELPEPELKRYRQGEYKGPEIEVVDYLDKVEVIAEVLDGHGRKWAVTCPWVDHHSGGDRSGTYVGQFNGGAPWFYCYHSHCERRNWRDFRRAVVPEKQIIRFRPRGSACRLEVIVDRG